MRLHDLIDWPEIEDKLKGLYKREVTRGGGPEPYAALSLFKLMLLGQCTTCQTRNWNRR